MKSIGLMALVLSLGACSTVTIRNKGQAKLSTEPTYADSKNYWFWGLGGESRVNVAEVCKGKEVKQMQAQSTVSDSLLSIVTLGIYYPRTAKVWCN